MQLSSGAIGLEFGISLPQNTYFRFANSEVCGETVQTHLSINFSLMFLRAGMPISRPALPLYHICIPSNAINFKNNFRKTQRVHDGLCNMLFVFFNSVSVIREVNMRGSRGGGE